MFSDDKIYMPTPQKIGRSNKMGRGPYEKSGFVEDTSLPPLRTVEERFEIFFPTEDVTENGKKIRKVLADELDLTVKLWYLPFGTMRTTPFLWREVNEKVRIKLDQ